MRGWARAGLLGVGALAAACSLLTNVPDIAGHAPPSDAGGNVGAPGDAGDAGADGPFCATARPQPMFCDDFDDETSLLARWDGKDDNPGGSVEIDSVASRSPPHSLLTALAASSSSCRYARVFKAFDGGSYRALTLAFSFMYEDPSDLTSSIIAEPSFRWDGGDCTALVWPRPPNGVIFVQEQTNGVNGGGQQNEGELSPSNVALEAGAWHRLVLDYDVDGKMKLTSDGVTVIDEPVKLACQAGGLHAVLNLGFHCQDPSSVPLRVHIDDVTFDAR